MIRMGWKHPKQDKLTDVLGLSVSLPLLSLNVYGKCILSKQNPAIQALMYIVYGMITVFCTM